MMAPISQLRDELRLTREALSKIAREAKDAAARFAGGAPDAVALYGCGALLHGYYTALERWLQVVARDFDGETLSGSEWHRRLLVASASERSARTAIIGSDTMAMLGRFLRFRHLFRNLYIFNLEWDELHPLLQKLNELHSLTERDLAAFDEFLVSLENSDMGT